MVRVISVTALAVLFLVGACIAATAEGDGGTVENGKKVSMDYTLTVDEMVVDSSAERGPMSFTVGAGEVIPGLEKELVGMKAGEEKIVVVAPEDAYGAVDPNAFQEVTASEFGEGANLVPGMPVQATSPDGRKLLFKVKEIKGDVVIVDLNHPLAGKTLNFKVKIVSVG